MSSVVWVFYDAGNRSAVTKMTSIVTFWRRLKIDKPLLYTPLTACPVGRLIFGEFFLLQSLSLVRHRGVAGITCWAIVTPALRRAAVETEIQRDETEWKAHVKTVYWGCHMVLIICDTILYFVLLNTKIAVAMAYCLWTMRSLSGTATPSWPAVEGGVGVWQRDGTVLVTVGSNCPFISSVMLKPYWEN